MATELKTAAVEFLTTTRIGEKGQLTVPKQFREDLGLGAGAPFTVQRMGDGLILIPEQRRFEELCRRVTTVLRRAKDRTRRAANQLTESADARI